MKAIIREVYNAATDLIVVLACCLLGGVYVGLFLGATAAFGFIVFNILMEVLL